MENHATAADNKLLLFFIGFLILVALVFGSGAIKNVAIPPAANPLSSNQPAQGDSVVGSPSLSGDYINKVLANAGSPAAGTGQSLHDLAAQYGIDDAYALAVFDHESSYGKYGTAFDNHSLGNIICAGYPTCNGRFRAYATWQEGYQDFYRLIKNEYVAHGLTTIETITPVYAPASENDPNGYISSVRQAMVTYRQESAA